MQMGDTLGDTVECRLLSAKGGFGGTLSSRREIAKKILSQRTNVVTHLFSRNPDFESQLKSMGRDF
jgi:hypothetical protein